ncbi:MAG: HD domain-containing protein [Acidobacteria bacterium]|nr:HD domain-containing protein [Acidobacteriota bacterium]
MDSAVANAATELVRLVSPPYLFNHAIRTFVFGSLVGRAQGLRFDEEVLYLACILHDLGLTGRFQGDLPFEIQGAEAARQFLEQQGFAKAKTAIVWDGIAMHVSMIGHFKQPEVRLVGEGAGADVIGPDPSQIGRTDVDQTIKAFPRLRFKTSFLNTCADVVRRHPAGASRSFMRDVGERYVPGFHPRNFCDYVISAPFAE